MLKSLSEQVIRPRKATVHQPVEHCLILRYRRVALLAHDPLGLAVQPCNFERQMEYLARTFNVISLGDLKRHLENATPFKDSTVAVTFDGGYSDVLYTAKAVLEKFGIPATVFMPSACLMERTPFWWDVLEDLLVADDGTQTRDRLVMEIDNRWCDWPLARPGDRFQAFEDLYAILSDKTPQEQKKLVREVAQGVGHPAGDLDHHTMLGIQEVKSLEEGGLIAVGGHTHNCVKLSALPERDQASEVRRNKQILEEILGHEIEHFAYPFGDQDYPASGTTKILKDLGFTLSCRAACDTVNVMGASTSHDLPRVTVGDWNPFAFHRRLHAFFR